MSSDRHLDSLLVVNMNAEHRERLASEEWRQSLKDYILPFTLGDLTITDLGGDVLEVGPGPGLTTDVLRAALPKLTAIELDSELADALEQRLAGTNVEVVNADATAMPLPDGRFTGAALFTMLHHVPTGALQDKLFAEVVRVLRPSGLFVASDGVAADDFEAMHTDDIYNPIDPGTLPNRLEALGFTDVDVRSNQWIWACHARRPS
jgi:SAM-dependent methyltransferase